MIVLRKFSEFVASVFKKRSRYYYKYSKDLTEIKKKTGFLTESEERH